MSMKPPYLPAHHAEYLKALHWENPHTTRLRAAIGDPLLCMAWSPKAKCWVIARKINVFVGDGVHEPAIQNIPMVWHNWVGDDGMALKPNDARLEKMIRFGDTWTRGSKAIVDQVEGEEDAVYAAKDRHQDNVIDDATRALQPALAKAASDLGLVKHRDTGNDAKKVTSAGLWADKKAKVVA